MKKDKWQTGSCGWLDGTRKVCKSLSRTMTHWAHVPLNLISGHVVQKIGTSGLIYGHRKHKRCCSLHLEFLDSASTMDLVLKICDDLFLDNVWASLVPLSAFTASPEFISSVNSSSIYTSLTSASKWTQFVSTLPHPPISPSHIASYSATHTLPHVSAWGRDYVPRQLLSLTAITLVGIHLLYFIVGSFSYYFIFNHEMKRHPRFLKDQVRLEIATSLRAFPGMMALTLPWFQAEVMGYSRLYDGLDSYGYAYLLFSVVLYVVFPPAQQPQSLRIT